MAKTELLHRVFPVDCMVGIPQHVKRGVPTLAVYDPPYNLGQPYTDYVDKKTQDEYIAYLKPRLAKTVEYLHPHGSLWLAINDANVSELDILCKRELGLFPRRKVIWHFTFGQHNSGNWTQSHITWLYYSKHRTKYQWDTAKIRVPSSRSLVYNDKRANPKGRVPNDTWVLLPEREPAAFKPLDNTWLFSRICGTFNAKITESPNQMPVPMLQRIIYACSKPGDEVMDGFNGSGSTGEAAILCGRKYVGFDISKKCVAATLKRLAGVRPLSAKRDDQLELFDEVKKPGKTK